MTVRAATLLVLAAIGAAEMPVAAQTECTPDRQSCVHRFNEPVSDGWGRDWSTDALPDAYQYGDNNVKAGYGFLRVLTKPDTPFIGNHTHLRWCGTEGFLDASATIEFFRIKGSTGWIDRKTNGFNPFEDCHPNQTPSRVSDSLFALTVADTGDAWVGVGFGGDLTALGKAVLLDQEYSPPSGFATLVALYKLSTNPVPIVLGYLQLPEIPLPSDDKWVVNVKVAQDTAKVWFVRVKASHDGNTMGSSFPLLQAPNLDGLVGVVPATNGAMSCIYVPKGEIRRAVAVSLIKAQK